MSLAPVGVALALSASRQFIPALLRNRRIGTIVADVTVEEQGVDKLVITKHPIEQGAAITDHSYKEPSTLTVRAGWSDASPFAFALLNPTINFAGVNLSPTGVSRASTIYAALLQLQADRVPFEVVTPQRTYINMLMARLQKTTDERSENALMVVIDFEEALIVSTEVVTVDPATLKFPGTNSPTLNKGTQNLQPAPSQNQ